MIMPYMGERQVVLKEMQWPTKFILLLYSFINHYYISKTGNKWSTINYSNNNAGNKLHIRSVLRLFTFSY